MLKPTNKHILVEVENGPDKIGSILVPENRFKDRPRAARVIAKGGKCDDIEVGQRILVPWFGGLPVQYQDKMYKLHTIEEIFGVLNEEAMVDI